MLAVAFLAPSFIMVFVIQGTSIIFQIVTYKFVWQNIVKAENHFDLLDEFS